MCRCPVPCSGFSLYNRSIQLKWVSIHIDWQIMQRPHNENTAALSQVLIEDLCTQLIFGCLKHGGSRIRRLSDTEALGYGGSQIRRLSDTEALRYGEPPYPRASVSESLRIREPPYPIASVSESLPIWEPPYLRASVSESLRIWEPPYRRASVFQTSKYELSA